MSTVTLRNSTTSTEMTFKLNLGDKMTTLINADEKEVADEFQIYRLV